LVEQALNKKQGRSTHATATATATAWFKEQVVVLKSFEDVAVLLNVEGTRITPCLLACNSLKIEGCDFGKPLTIHNSNKSNLPLQLHIDSRRQ
jgi:hypothetical protein